MIIFFYIHIKTLYRRVYECFDLPEEGTQAFHRLILTSRIFIFLLQCLNIANIVILSYLVCSTIMTATTTFKTTIKEFAGFAFYHFIYLTIKSGIGSTISKESHKSDTFGVFLRYTICFVCCCDFL